MKKSHEEQMKKLYAEYEQTFGVPYPHKQMTEEERKELYQDYSRVFDYEPSEEEVKKRYSKEFNDWIECKKE